MKCDQCGKELTPKCLIQTCANNSNKENTIPDQNSSQDDKNLNDSTNKENMVSNNDLSHVDKSLHNPPIKEIKEQVNNFLFWKDFAFFNYNIQYQTYSKTLEP